MGGGREGGRREGGGSMGMMWEGTRGGREGGRERESKGKERGSDDARKVFWACWSYCI